MATPAWAADRELVFSLPRARRLEDLAAANSTANAALRRGRYKLILTAVYCDSYRPAPDVEPVDADTCAYEWNSVSGGSLCSWQNFLFDVEADPTERENLWHDGAYADVRESLVARVRELMATNPYDYSELMPEFYKRNLRKDVRDRLEARLREHDYWIVPWDCEAVP